MFFKVIEAKKLRFSRNIALICENIRSTSTDTINAFLKAAISFGSKSTLTSFLPPITSPILNKVSNPLEKSIRTQK